MIFKRNSLDSENPPEADEKPPTKVTWWTRIRGFFKIKSSSNDIELGSKKSNDLRDADNSFSEKEG